MKEIKGQVLALIRQKQEVIRNGITSCSCKSYDDYVAACRMIRDFDLLLDEVRALREEDE